MPRTAAVVVIGNEILSGKVRDDNSPYLAAELRALGVALRLILVVPDEEEEIARVVRECSRRFDYVFTTGGVGPTHDDVTFRAVARAFGVGLRESPEIKRSILRRCPQPSEEVLSMARVPQGAEVLELPGVSFPPVRMGNVYIFPGIPQYLREKFQALRERFRERPFFTRRVYVAQEECHIATELRRLDEEFPQVQVGSYPQVDAPGHKVVVVLEGQDEQVLEEALQRLLELLPGDIVVRTE